MSGTFNGSADLRTASSVWGSTPTYPCLMAMWVRQDAIERTTNGVYMSVSDADALTYMECRFTTDGIKPITGTVNVAGTSGTSTSGSSVADDAWTLVGTLFTSATSRQSFVGTTLSTANTTNLAPTTLDTTAIGAWIFSGFQLNPSKGDYAEAVFASGFDIADINDILTALNNGEAAYGIAQLQGFIDAYQPLLTGVNDTNYIGPTFTNTNVTFNSGNHPTITPPEEPEEPGGTVEVFTTPGAASWVCPSGVTEVMVECWGGGADGFDSGGTNADGGGGGGAYARSILAVTPSTSYSYYVGDRGETAEDTWFDTSSTVKAKGAFGGTGGPVNTSIGDVKFRGGHAAAPSGGSPPTIGGGGGSSAGPTSGGTSGSGQTGGSAPTDGGDGGDGGNATHGSNGQAPGGGGGGAGHATGFSYNGGNGAPGQIRLTYEGPASTISRLGLSGIVFGEIVGTHKIEVGGI